MICLPVNRSLLIIAVGSSIVRVRLVLLCPIGGVLLITLAVLLHVFKIIIIIIFF